MVSSDDILLVGLSTGTLRVYRINAEPTNHDGSFTASDKESASITANSAKQEAESAISKTTVELLREYEKFSKYKVERLVLLRDASSFLALSNAAVQVHDLKTCELKEILSGSKGATSLESITLPSQSLIDGESSQFTTRVAVAVKRKVLLWEWSKDELISSGKDFTFVSGVKSLTWITEKKLVVGTASNYMILDVDSAVTTDIVGPGSIGGAPGQDGGRFGGAGVAGMGYLGITAPIPLATKITDHVVLLAKDINTHFIDLDGNAIGRRQIPWSNAPSAIASFNPYLLSLQTGKGVLEIRNPKTLTCLQTVQVPSATQLVVVSSESRWPFGNDGMLALSERAIWRIELQDFHSQINQLVQISKLDEAISILDQISSARLADRGEQTRKVRMLKAQTLFDQTKFRDSIDLFTAVSAPPERVISLFPELIAGPSFVDPGHTTEDGSTTNSKTSKHGRKPSSTKSHSSRTRESRSDSISGGGTQGSREDGEKRKPLGKLVAAIKV